jgi:hypothetical protein
MDLRSFSVLSYKKSLTFVSLDGNVDDCNV